MIIRYWSFRKKIKEKQSQRTSWRRSSATTKRQQRLDDVHPKKTNNKEKIRKEQQRTSWRRSFGKQRKAITKTSCRRSYEEMTKTSCRRSYVKEKVIQGKKKKYKDGRQKKGIKRTFYDVHARKTKNQIEKNSRRNIKEKQRKRLTGTFCDVRKSTD